MSMVKLTINQSKSVEKKNKMSIKKGMNFFVENKNMLGENARHTAYNDIYI